MVRVTPNETTVEALIYAIYLETYGWPFFSFSSDISFKEKDTFEIN